MISHILQIIQSLIRRQSIRLQYGTPIKRRREPRDDSVDFMIATRGEGAGGAREDICRGGFGEGVAGGGGDDEGVVGCGGGDDAEGGLRVDLEGAGGVAGVDLVDVVVEVALK